MVEHFGLSVRGCLVLQSLRVLARLFGSFTTFTIVSSTATRKELLVKDKLRDRTGRPVMQPILYTLIYIPALISCRAVARAQHLREDTAVLPNSHRARLVACRASRDFCRVPHFLPRAKKTKKCGTHFVRRRQGKN